MNDIEYKIQTLIEKRDFDKLTPAEKEMVYSVMSEDEFTDRREVILQSETLFGEERELLVPDAGILNSLKDRISQPLIIEKELDESKAPMWWSYKVSIAKSAAAMLLLLLGSYLLFGNTRVEYIEKEIVVEKKIRDTIYQEKIVSVPVEKIVEVPVERIVNRIEYRNASVQLSKSQNETDFSIQELKAAAPEKSVQLRELSTSFGNSKIDKAELEQFRVSL